MYSNIKMSNLNLLLLDPYQYAQREDMLVFYQLSYDSLFWRLFQNIIKSDLRSFILKA